MELAEAETRAAQSREGAHARELSINRDQQQLGFDREQIQALDARTAAVAAEIQVLEQRREPASLLVHEKKAAAADASARRDQAGDELTRDSGAYESAHREIEGLEADVEGARSEVFSALNSATALRHALEHAGAARERVAETLTKLDVELEDVRIESEHVEAARAAAAELMHKAQDALEATRIARLARESELASARIEHEWRSRSVRAREQELAGLEARLRSLEELEAARAGFGDAARAVLAHANGQVGQRGAVADYLEVESGYERAVEACLGELLQHVVVERNEQAAAGFALVRREGVGRCGFVIAGSADAGSTDAHAGVTSLHAATDHALPHGIVSLSSVVRVNGPFAGVIRAACSEAWIADVYEHAAGLSALAPVPIATRAGDVFRGPHVVSGGGPDEARGILETKREIRELRDRVDREHKALADLIEETAGFEATILLASTGIAALHAEHHKQEKAMVGYDAQLQHASNETTRLTRKGEQLIRERRQAEEERLALDRRQEEAHASIARLEQEQRSSDERLTAAQRRLFEARESAEDLSHRAAEARAAHAALVERAAALEAEVRRLEEANAEMELRIQTLAGELEQARTRAGQLRTAVELSVARLDADIRALDGLKEDVRAADDAVANLRRDVDERETVVRDARLALETVRGLVAELDVARATAEADLAHLAQTCVDSVQMNLDEVTEEVAQLEREGHATPDGGVILAEESDESGDEEEGHAAAPAVAVGEALADLALPDAAVVAAQQKALSAEEAIAALRAKIDRLGPVNMMAIEQFEELETRHAFLSTQRQDLVDSIQQTSEAIKRIDETTRQRFAEAFLAINRNFQETFSTLFGGGRAGLTLLDESDPLESGIEIIAQPPGKRLQSVQLLSGGEKALTAIALMFGLFKYKPSPFCLLDEIDAPLDDANIGRFVEMLRGMQQHTQFILITHNRKTMEIADRLYGVTMEEPGVSKLISVQLH
jgi:chromosome segregation protein